VKAYIKHNDKFILRGLSSPEYIKSEYELCEISKYYNPDASEPLWEVVGITWEDDNIFKKTQFHYNGICEYYVSDLDFKDNGVLERLRKEFIIKEVIE
jgi:hypothetical protein